MKFCDGDFFLTMGGDPSAARMCMGHAMVHELPQRCMADMVSMRPQHGPQQSTFGMAENKYNCRLVLLKNPLSDLHSFTDFLNCDLQN